MPLELVERSFATRPGALSLARSFEQGTGRDNPQGKIIAIDPRRESGLEDQTICINSDCPKQSLARLGSCGYVAL